MKPTHGNAEPQLGENDRHAKQGLGAPSVPPGYKQTDVCLIPEDWKVRNLSEVSQKITAGDHLTPNRTSQSYYL